MKMIAARRLEFFCIDDESFVGTGPAAVYIPPVNTLSCTACAAQALSHAQALSCHQHINLTHYLHQGLSSRISEVL